MTSTIRYPSMAEWAGKTVNSAALIALAGQSHGYKEILAAVGVLREAPANPRAGSPTHVSNPVKSLKFALDCWENQGDR